MKCGPQSERALATADVQYPCAMQFDALEEELATRAVSVRAAVADAPRYLLNGAFFTAGYVDGSYDDPPICRWCVARGDFCTVAADRLSNSAVLGSID